MLLPYNGDEPYIFISYAHKDTDKVFPIIREMIERGFRVWYDAGIEGGFEWPQFIATKLNSSSCVLAFISQTAVDSQNCRQEITFAIARNKSLLSIYLEDFELPLGMQMQLGTLQAISCTTPETYRQLLPQLISNPLLTPSFAPTAEKAIPPELERIELSSLPNKLRYIEGQPLDLTGLVVTAVMNNGQTKTVDGGYAVSGYLDVPGRYTITISYLEKSAMFDVTVVERTLVSLALSSFPDKKDYVSGQAFDCTGLEILALYDNDDVVVVEDYELSGFNDTPGIKFIGISLKGKSVSFTVNVVARAIIDLRLTALPSKLDYVEDDILDTTGLTVEAVYNDETTEALTDYVLTGFSSTPGTHTVIITYEGFTTSFEVNVAPSVLTGIKVTLPAKVAYYVGEDFDGAGMIVTACYSNGKEAPVDDYQVTGFHSSAVGKQTVTVTYCGISYSFIASVQEQDASDESIQLWKCTCGKKNPRNKRKCSCGNWYCRCGKVYPSYVSGCVCGGDPWRNYSDDEFVVDPQPIKKTEPQPIVEEEKIVPDWVCTCGKGHTADIWRCSCGNWHCSCGKIYPRYVSSCVCGLNKDDIVQLKADYEEFVAGRQYFCGDKVTFENANYICVIENGMQCVWSPSQHPAYWKKVAE